MVNLTKFRGLSARSNGADAARPLDPEAIFRRAPKGASSFPDLWRGQADALRQWHTGLRDQADVLISLNTGAGKTVVGCLIAQSLVNEGLDHVVYACGTIDLVRQTEGEAKRLGLSPSLRIQQAFTDDRFETGQARCITTYGALYQPFSTFRRSFLPAAIIFDDAHTSEGYLRDAFTLQIERRKYPEVFESLCRLFSPAFKQIGRSETFDGVVSDASSRTTLLVPPFFAYEKVDAIAAILKTLRSDKTNLGFPFKWGAIADHLGYCAVTITSSVVEFSPPFLPFEGEGVRRVYLSATINYKSDLILCCGREISDKNLIAPKNDAGEGERLVLFAKYLKEDEMAKTTIPAVSKNSKLVVPVPSYEAAKRWSALATPPRAENFSDALASFRRQAEGVFILVFRLDGIDLPDEVCRIMVMDGLPTGAAQLERYQWQMLHMTNAFAAKIASRTTQIFGRINRGTRDYSVHIVEGRALNTWLSAERNLSLLSPLLRSQIQLGHALQEQLQIRDTGTVCDIVSQVLNRDPEWLEIYRTEIQDKDLDPSERARSAQIEEKMIVAAKAEVRFAGYWWQGQIDEARRALEDAAADVSRGDSRLGGWFNVWIGCCFDIAGDTQSGQIEYQRARQKLGATLALPLGSLKGPGFQLDTAFESKMGLTLLGTPEACDRQERLFANNMRALNSSDCSAFELEETVRQLGEHLGFEASRPDNEGEGGPDVVWHDPSSATALGFELKTDKKAKSSYTVEETGKGLGYLVEWLKKEYKGEKCLGLVFIGPKSSLTRRASTSAEMYVAELTEIRLLSNEFSAFLREARTSAPGPRVAFIKRKGREVFSLAKLFERLSTTSMDALPRSPN